MEGMQHIFKIYTYVGMHVYLNIYTMYTPIYTYIGAYIILKLFLISKWLDFSLIFSERHS